MHSFTRLAQLLAGSGLLLAGLSQAAAPIDWEAFNASTISGHIQPRYQQLAHQSQTLAETTAHWCNARSSDDFNQVQQAFENSLQAWQGIQHVQFGPVQLLMRNYGIQFWPDRKGITGRQLQAALNGPDAGQYDDAFFHQASISIKGFPALERLLYSTDALSQLQRHPHACALATAISTRLAQTGQELATEWQTLALDDQRSENDDGTTASVPDLSLNLLRALVQPVEVIRDSKLEAVLGEDQTGARLQRAENWRSGQSLASIASNLEALQDLYAGGEPSLDRILRTQGATAQADQIGALFTQARAQLAAVAGPLAVALENADSYGQLRALSATLKSLDEALYDAMPAIDAQLGFNSRDGD
ncbi:imelysin family protein [Marinobacterium sedimentorum]|uniref:imelysin family protein n=1 Tax=Marinobacterium sedimentorum TaxID=2927804 RepID=UPI0020C66EBF|nr:imelysin family protein [Marinobacterium sedimentorum]MCP8688280.1 imelysin family protein [Marinobacterium sedimentorum]